MAINLTRQGGFLKYENDTSGFVKYYNLNTLEVVIQGSALSFPDGNSYTVAQIDSPVYADVEAFADAIGVFKNEGNAGGLYAATRTIFVGKHGSDSNVGTSDATALLTFNAAITAATALTPVDGSLVAIRCIDAGTYSEPLLIIPPFVNIHAESAKLVNAGAHNTIQIDNNTHVHFNIIEQDGTGAAAVVGTNTVGQRFVWANTVIAGGASTGLINFAIASTGQLFARINRILVGTGKGVSDNSLDGQTHMYIGSIDISGNNGIGIFKGSGGGFMSGHIIHIQETGTPTGTVGLDIDAGTVELNVNHIIADTAYNVASGATLEIITNNLVGTEVATGTVKIIKLSDITGSGSTVQATSPTLVTPNLGTPSAAVLTNATGLPVAGLASGTDGELITWDAAGNAATVAVGTATHVLTSNGAGAAPTFQAAAAAAAVKEYYGSAPLTVTNSTQSFFRSNATGKQAMEGSAGMGVGSTFDPHIVCVGGTMTKIRVTISGGCVSQGTVGASPTVRIDIYKMNQASRTLLLTARPVFAAGTIGINTTPTADDQTAELVISTAISAGDRLGWEFVPETSDNNKMNGLIETQVSIEVTQ